MLCAPDSVDGRPATAGKEPFAETSKIGPADFHGMEISLVSLSFDIYGRPLVHVI